MDLLSDSDREFIEKFESCGLQKTCLNHEAHVRMAWIQFARTGSYAEALEKIRSGILRFNASVGGTGYHETVTVAFARVIYSRFLRAPRRTWPEFLKDNSDLLAKDPPFLHTYYSPQLLTDARGKSEFLNPDRRALPPAGLVRPVSQEDAEDLLAIYGPYVNHTAVSFEAQAPSPAEFRKRIDENLSYAPWLVYEVDGKIAGYAYASKHRSREAYQWAIEVSVYVDEKYQNVGIGRLLYTRLFEELKQRRFHILLAGIALPNEASVGLHESMGFEPVGIYRGIGFKMGRWHDVGWWQKRLRPAGEAPTAPPIIGPH